MGFQEYKRKIEKNFCRMNQRVALRNMKDNTISTYTYGDIKNICIKFSLAIEKYNIHQGERIVIVSSSNADCLLAFYAVTYNHMTAVFIKPSMPKEELVSCIKKCDASLVLTNEDIYKSKLSEGKYNVLNLDGASFNVISENKTLVTGRETEDDVAVLLFSSGTSGVPKPVMITFDAVLLSKKILIKTSDTSRRDSLLCAFPIFHAGGFFSAVSMSMCGCLINTVEGYSTEKTSEYMNIFQPTYFGMIPPVIENLFTRMEQTVKSKGARWQKRFQIAGKLSVFSRKYLRLRWLSRLLMRPFFKEVFGKRMKCIFVGAMKSSDELAKKTQKYGLDWFNAYTCTECSCPIVTTIVQKAYTNFSNGKTNWSRAIKLKIVEQDENGVGEICVKTPLIMKGYFRDEKATMSAFDEDGFYKTGDLAYEDEHNVLHLVGRMSEIIHLHNGEKLSPEVFENTLSSCFKDSNCPVVCGVPSLNGSYDEIHIFIEDRGYSEKDKEELNRKILLASKGYSVKDIHYVKQISYTDLRKPKRFELIKTINTNSTVTKEPETPFEYFLWLIASQTMDKAPTLDEHLSSFGLDSLLIYTIASRMKEKFEIDIVPMLSSAVTFNDLKRMIECGEAYEKNIVDLKKIQKNELRKMAVLRAECMMDYPLYKVIYKDPKRRWRQLLYTSWFMLYRYCNFTYVNKERTVLLSIKKPKDVYKSTIGLIFNPRFFFGMISCLTIDSLRKIHSYIKIEEETERKHFNPSSDYYLCHLCVAKEERSKGIYDSLMSMLDASKKYYFVTHSIKNVRLYEKYDAKICETVMWKGVAHYCLVRDPQL